jgi:hypothetical protein
MNSTATTTQTATTRDAAYTAALSAYLDDQSAHINARAGVLVKALADRAAARKAAR